MFKRQRGVILNTLEKKIIIIIINWGVHVRKGLSTYMCLTPYRNSSSRKNPLLLNKMTSGINGNCINLNA